jgi:hypothetical protein
MWEDKYNANKYYEKQVMLRDYDTYMHGNVSMKLPL